MSKNTISNPRLILPRLRDGDYAHAGDKEAIDIVLNKIKCFSQSDSDIKGISNNSQNKKALDVGCGLGGTAEYVRSATAYDVYGVDIDEAALTHARKHYPYVKFFQYDVDVAKDIQLAPLKEKFDIIYMFNVFYVISDQRGLLEKLAKIAKQDAILAIFDYTKPGKNSIFLNDLSGKSMNPICVDDLLIMLDKTGWSLIEVDDLTYKYEEWYGNIIINFENSKVNLLDDFTEEAVDKVHHTFSSLLKMIQDKRIGGGIIYAKRLISETKLK